MKYLRQPSKHNIVIKASQKQKLRNIGYYHGFKGYRYIRTPNRRILFNSFDEILALNEFDMKLKTIFYPEIMFIETALKNYVIEEVLNASKSENLDVIFNKSITYYKTLTPGSDSYKKEFSKRMALKGKINSALIRDYDRKQAIVNHFFDNDKSIPIWAIFESITLGEFGTFFACLDTNVKLNISRLVDLPRNMDADGKIIQFIIYTIKDLRNAIAHNNVIFDTRFNTGTINNRLITCLSSEMGIPNITFTNIDDYIILSTYILRKMKVTKTEIRQFIRNFTNAIEALRNEIPINIYNQIINTNVRNKLRILDNYLKTH